MVKAEGVWRNNTASKYAQKRVPISVIIATGMAVALSPTIGKSISFAEPLADTTSKAELVSSLFSKSESERTWSVDSIFSDVGIQKPTAREAKARDNLLWLFSNSTDASQINDVVNDYFSAKGLNRRSLLLLGDVVGEIKGKGVPVVSPGTLVLHMVYVNGDSTSANLRSIPNSVFVVMDGLENTYDKYCGSGTGAQAAEPATTTANDTQHVWNGSMTAVPQKPAIAEPKAPAVAKQNLPTDNTRVTQPRASKPAFAAKPKPRPVHAAAAKITKIIKEAKKKHHEHHAASIIRHVHAAQQTVAAAEPAKNAEPSGFAKFLATEKKIIRYATYGIIAVIGLLGLGAGARALYLRIADNGREKKALKTARKVLLSNSMYRITPALDFESITKRAYELAKKRRDRAGAKMFLRAIKAELKKGFLLGDPRMMEFSRKINSL
jgi:hypothetical protein